MSSTSRKFSTVIVRAICCGLVIGGLAGPLAQRSVAALFTLIDDNSSADFNTASSSNNFSWTVDGVNQLFEQSFWYRIGNVAEQSVHLLPITLQGTTDTNFDALPDTLFVRYNNGAGLQIETSYKLDGGLPASGSSDLAEQISITNQSASPMDFHFFQYADFDLKGTADFDSAEFTNVNTVQQSEGASQLQETVITPVPSHREIDFFANTLNKLTDAVPTTLSDTPLGTVVGPGDVTWAYQWDFVLAPNQTFLISKDKNMSTPGGGGGGVPEPATGFLLSLAAGLLLTGYRSRRIALG